MTSLLIHLPKAAAMHSNGAFRDAEKRDMMQLSTNPQLSSAALQLLRDGKLTTLLFLIPFSLSLSLALPPLLLSH